MRMWICVLAACGGSPRIEPIAGTGTAPPVADRMVALGITDGSEGGIVLAKVTRDQVSVIANLDGRDFGWLDEHDLVVARSDDKGTIVTRYTDGRRADTY